jgi:hypothetical protein
MLAAPLAILPMLALSFTMPLCELDARRLVLVRTPESTSSAAEIARHVSATHGDSVRYMMSASSEEAVGLLNMLVEAIQPLTLGMLATSQSTALDSAPSTEAVDDTESRALETRDYVLRGTLDGGTSVLISHESVIELLLLRAADPDSGGAGPLVEGVPDVAVLDFGAGAYPWMVADERPMLRPPWRLAG